jgi:universal stress protein E
MTALRRILVAVRDPQDPPRRALAKAAALARQSGATIELFHAVSDFLAEDAVRQDRRGLDTQPLMARIAAHRGEQLERLGRGLARDVKLTTQAVWDYPAHEAIVRRAAKTRADLVIAESHAHRLGTRWFLTNTDWELIRICAVPLLLAKTDRPYANPRIVVALDPLHAHDKPGSLDARLLETGRSFARKLGGELHAAHAYVPLVMAAPVAMPVPVPTWTPKEAEEEHRKGVEQAFNRAASRGRVPREHRHLLVGAAHVELERLVRQLRAQLLVIGAVSRSGLQRLFIGSTAERLLDRVPCDVLVVKPKSFRSPVPRAVQEKAPAGSW